MVMGNKISASILFNKKNINLIIIFVFICSYVYCIYKYKENFLWDFINIWLVLTLWLPYLYLYIFLLYIFTPIKESLNKIYWDNLFSKIIKLLTSFVQYLLLYVLPFIFLLIILSKFLFWYVRIVVYLISFIIIIFSVFIYIYKVKKELVIISKKKIFLLILSLLFFSIILLVILSRWLTYYNLKYSSTWVLIQKIIFCNDDIEKEFWKDVKINYLKSKFYFTIKSGVLWRGIIYLEWNKWKWFLVTDKNFKIFKFYNSEPSHFNINYKKCLWNEEEINKIKKLRIVNF
jgi:hypothetical protein